MAWGEVKLAPGVNAERTPTLLEAGYRDASLIRFRDGLAEKLGGFLKFYPFSVPGIPRALHAWADLNLVNHLADGTTAQLGFITSGSLQDITPQTITTNPPQGIFTTTNGSPIVDVNDSQNLTNSVTVTAGHNQLFIFTVNSPISVGETITEVTAPASIPAGTTVTAVSTQIGLTNN